MDASRRMHRTALCALAALAITCSNGSPKTPVHAPAGLTYQVNPAVYAVGTAIAANAPSSSGGAVSSYSVTPALPAGLSLDTSTGVLSGTPSAVTPAATYVVTASNSAGTATVELTITVTTAGPPTGLTYSVNPAVYAVGIPIIANTPSSSGGAVTSYSVAPALPAGLSLDGSTGVVTGTPSAVAPAATYVVTGSNSAGTATTGLTITVNAAVVPPAGLTYSVNPALYMAGIAIAPNRPSSSGGAIASYSVAPPLPAGLGLNGSTGVISGTPAAAAQATTYVVTGSNSAGTVTTALTITVLAAGRAAVPPSGLTYSVNPASYTVGTAIPTNTASSSGGAVASYSVSPPLPAGLGLNTATGAISGVPTSVTPTATYVVTASNSGGAATTGLTITVNAAGTGVVPPSGLAYSMNPAVYFVGTAIGANTPSVGGGAVASYSVSPALPAGLSLNTATGVIAGTPAAVAPTATYVVTATNSGGSATAAVTITVNGAQPDTEAPRLVSLSFSPQTVTVDGGSAATTTASLRVTDAGTGVSSIQVSVVTAGGVSLQCGPPLLMSGTINDGIWTCTVPIPAGSAPGPSASVLWTSYDNTGNRFYGVDVSSLSSGITIVDPQPDGDAPRLVSISFSPATVTLNGAVATTTATLHVTDAGTGLADLRVALRTAHGNVLTCGPFALVSGDRNDGTYTCTIAIPAGSAAGAATFDSWTAWDNTSNVRQISGDAAAAFSSGIVIVNDAIDIDPPQLVSISFSPQTVALNGGSASTTATFHVTDVGTGVSENRLSIRTANGTLLPCGNVLQWATADLVSGTVNDGIWTCVITIPVGSVPGPAPFEWDCRDATGNRTVVDGATATGYPPGITIQP